MKILISLIIVQMNLVCGGIHSDDGLRTRLSSCEINKVGEKTWSPMTSLPGKREGVRGLTFGTQVFMMGNIRLVQTIINMLITIFRRLGCFPFKQS